MVHVRTEKSWLKGLRVQTETRGVLTMALLKIKGYLWLSYNDPANQLIHLETTVPMKNRSSLISSVWGVTHDTAPPYPPGYDSVLFASPHLAPNAHHVCLQRASCSFLELPRIITSHRVKQPQLFFVRKTTAFNQVEAFITLCTYTATVFYGYQFSFPGFWSQRTHQEGRSRRVQVSWPCKLVVTVICLPSFPWFLLQPACSLHRCFIAFSFGLPNGLHSEHTARVSSSAFSPFPATCLSPSGLLKNE